MMVSAEKFIECDTCGHVTTRYFEIEEDDFFDDLDHMSEEEIVFNHLDGDSQYYYFDHCGRCSHCKES